MKLRPLYSSKKTPAPLNFLPPSLSPPSRTDRIFTLLSQGHTPYQVMGLLHLTPGQFNYARYIQPTLSLPSRVPAPLTSLVPQPITKAHKTSSGAYTRRFITQIMACRGRGHSLKTVADYFHIAPPRLFYLWYQSRRSKKVKLD